MKKGVALFCFVFAFGIILASTFSLSDLIRISGNDVSSTSSTTITLILGNTTSSFSGGLTHTISLLQVNSSGVLMDVDNSSTVIGVGQNSTVNGVNIYVVSAFPSTGQTPGSATLSISSPSSAAESNSSAPCNPDYQCSDWSSCVSGQQNKTCTDSNGCAPTSVNVRACSPEQPSATSAEYAKEHGQGAVAVQNLTLYLNRPANFSVSEGMFYLTLTNISYLGNSLDYAIISLTIPGYSSQSIASFTLYQNTPFSTGYGPEVMLLSANPGGNGSDASAQIEIFDQSSASPFSCSASGYACVSSEACGNAGGQVLQGYTCPGETICCSSFPPNLDRANGQNYQPSSNGNAVSASCSTGCEYNGKCIPFGYRVGTNYCDVTGNLTSQITGGACDNNFQCSSNLCVNSQCVTPSVIQQIINFFSKLLGI